MNNHPADDVPIPDARKVISTRRLFMLTPIGHRPFSAAFAAARCRPPLALLDPIAASSLISDAAAMVPLDAADGVVGATQSPEVTEVSASCVCVCVHSAGEAPSHVP